MFDSIEEESTSPRRASGVGRTYSYTQDQISPGIQTPSTLYVFHRTRECETHRSQLYSWHTEQPRNSHGANVMPLCVLPWDSRGPRMELPRFPGALAVFPWNVPLIFMGRLVELRALMVLP